MSELSDCKRMVDQYEARIKNLNARLEQATAPAGWYINEAGDKVELCSAADAIMFGLHHFSEDAFGLLDFLTEWNEGTIEPWQAEFNKWKKRKR